jgi:hypothetical protein
MRRYFPLVLVTVWCAMTSVGSAQTPSREKAIADFYWRTGHHDAAMFYIQLQESREKDKPEGKKEPAKPAALEQLIAEALKNNPDIRVAEAKSREAAAELDRVRLKVASHVAILHADIKAAEASLAEGKSRYDRAMLLYKQNAIAVEEVESAKLTMLKLESELAAAKAKLPYLLGRQAGSGGVGNSSPPPDKEPSRKVSEDLMRAWIAKTDFPYVGKLRKALDAPVKLEANNLQAKDAVVAVANKMSGVNVILRAKISDKRTIDLSFKESIPLGAALQYLEDELGIVFVLREYGIVGVAADERIPPDAVRLIEFWKHRD